MSNESESGPKRLNMVLKEQPGPVGLIARARQLAQVWGRLVAILPAELTEGWQLARVEPEQMVITTDSPGRVTRLRYAQPQLLAAVEQVTGIRPKALKVKVLPPEPVRTPPPRAQLSPEAAAALEQAASGMADPRVGATLERLARRARQKGRV